MPELPTSHPFAWTDYPWGPALRCRALAGVADHCFTTRQPDIPADVASDGEAWPRVASAFGVTSSEVVRLRQVHGARVVTVRRGEAREAAGTADVRDDADGVVGNDPGVALSVRVADCVPILMADPTSGAVAAVHAGWRGAASGIVPAAVDALRHAFGVRPADLVAAVGPCIGPCCYRVGAELRDAFVSAGHAPQDVGRWFAADAPARAARGVPGTDPASAASRPALWLDMWRVVSDHLAQAGLAPDHVHVSRLCTSCGRDVFHSFRVDGPAAGRMVAVIRGRPGR